MQVELTSGKLDARLLLGKFSMTLRREFTHFSHFHTPLNYRTNTKVRMALVWTLLSVARLSASQGRRDYGAFPNLTRALAESFRRLPSAARSHWTRSWGPLLSPRDALEFCPSCPSKPSIPGAHESLKGYFATSLPLIKNLNMYLQ